MRSCCTSSKIYPSIDDSSFPPPKFPGENTHICSICFLSFSSENSSSVELLKCGHFFHEECIQAWIVKKNHHQPRCPFRCSSFNTTELGFVQKALYWCWWQCMPPHWRESDDPPANPFITASFSRRLDAISSALEETMDQIRN